MLNDEVDEPCVCPTPEKGLLPEDMYWAARNGDTDKVKSWLEGGGDINAADHEGDTMLRGACRGGQNAVLMILLKNEDLHLNVRDRDGRTPLMKAARRGHETTIRIMCAAKLKCKLNYTAQDHKGNTAHSLALQNEFIQVCRFLSQECHRILPAQDTAVGSALHKKKKKHHAKNQEKKEKNHSDALNLGRVRIQNSSSDEAETEAMLESASPLAQPMESGQVAVRENVYTRTCDRRGRVCIFNFKQFPSRQDLLRKGSECDFINLEKLFTGLEYDVQGYWNLGKDQTLETLTQFAKHEQFIFADCAIIIIMSHGEKGSIFKTSDMQDISVSTVCNIFLDKNCPHLKGKPKIFLFNFCRGIDRHESSSLSTDAIAEPPRDMLCVYSTTESFVSYRDIERGCPFVTTLCDVIAKYSSTLDLEALLRKFNELYMPDVTPEIQNFRFQKKFYF
ncbi:caspase-13-like isoform X3 [Penaeus monodon]|nr:caspase-13-like isoform X3 [Penaeus monodon]XP_037788258.1 caspase-13-like isoform X3 [Penaeus monodon]